MKKLISCVLTLVFILAIPIISLADFDLSGLSFDELVALKDQINLAIWNSAEWQEVEVPQGIWEVGADIPEGHWTIKATQGKYTAVYVGPEVTNGGTSLDWDTFCYITDEGYSSFDAKEDVTSWSIELKSGDFVKVERSSCVFTPYSGKMSLGFN